MGGRGHARLPAPTRLPRLPAAAQTPTQLDTREAENILRPVRSEQDLAEMNSMGMFTRKSSFADVPYLALPGISSRVSLAASQSQQSVGSELDVRFIPQGDMTLMPTFTPALLKATFAALLSAFQFGYNNGNMNTQADVMRESLSIPAHAPNGTPLGANDSIWGFCVSVFCLGALVGCNLSGQLADRWGRKHFLLVNNLLFMVGGLTESLCFLPPCACPVSEGPLAALRSHALSATLAGVATDPTCICVMRVLALVIGRTVSGIACGGTTVVVPMYLGEISPPQLRGTLGTAFQLTMVLAMLFAQVLGLPAFLGTLELWPFLLALICAPAAMQLLLQAWLLESPRWYVMAGMEVPAEDALMQLRDTPIDDPQLQEELFCMVEACGGLPSEAERPRGAAANGTNGDLPQNGARSSDGYASPEATSARPTRTLWSLIWDPALRLPLAIAVGLMVLQQWSGINNAFNYSSTFLSQNSVDPGSAGMVREGWGLECSPARRGACADTIMVIAVAMNVGNVFITAVSVYLMDRAGRRALLLGSTVAMTLSTILLTAALKLTGRSWTAGLAVVAIVSFVMSFGIGIGALKGAS